MNTPIKAGVAVAALAALWAAGTAYSGKQLQTELLAQAEGWKAQANSPLRVTQIDYQKGFASSTRTLHVQFGCMNNAEGSPEPLKLTWRDRIQHGPLPGFGAPGAARIESELLLSEAQAQALKKLTGLDSLPIALSTLVGFGGNTDTRISVPAFSLQPDANSQFHLKGLQARVQLARDGSAHFEGDLPGYELHSAQGGVKVLVKDAHFESAGLAPLWWALTGKGQGRIGQISLQGTGADGKPSTLFSIDGLTYTQDGQIKDQLYSAQMQLQGKGQVGGMALDAVSMKMRMERLHTAPYLALVQAAMTQGCAVGDDPKAQLEALTAPLLQLLPHNPLMSVDEIKLSLGGKSAQFSYSVGTQGVTADDLKAPAMAPVLMKKAVFKMGAQTSAEFIQQLAKASGKELPPEALAQQIEMAVNQGFVQRQGDKLAAEVEWKAGAMLLNGKPMPLPGLSQPQPQPELEAAPAPQ
ncbi:uncharacterized protein YdgA (DUF945 family) [Inhella inkyongensis]|uniref:Uncharacterized protein YdgA (DUF945 family) n=1 Tax=Inhella inkyongensis TaxID=392593 RepID=A0A840S2S0_9BURK|nr:YdgA family protein [Inhella inkyongensis]MBB5205497.1 uncharacterized protein YdgA (DUF945 family) [Inhella inkyongensis]